MISFLENVNKCKFKGLKKNETKGEKILHISNFVLFEKLKNEEWNIVFHR